MREKFSPEQKNVLGASALLYTAAYINRLNLSAALGGIMDALAFDAGRAGLLQTAFAVTYALGQLINGALVDRLNPVRHMLLGLAGSALCNLLLGASAGDGWMVFLCACNGAFQSMLWTPIVRLLALHFTTQKSRERANMLVTATLVAGHFAAWLIAGYLSGLFSWRHSFIVPALVAVPVLFGASFMLRGVRTGRAERVQDAQPRAGKPALPLFLASGLVLLLVASVLYGFVRDGIITWAPQLLSAAGDSAVSGATVSLLIPLINALGLWAGYALLKRGRAHNRHLVAYMMLAAGVFCLPLMAVTALLPMALLMGCACACLYGLNPILTGLVPLEYDRARRVGLSAGLIDSCIYVGSALAGLLGGRVYAAYGSRALFISWIALSALAFVLAWASGRRRYLAAPESAGE